MGIFILTFAFLSIAGGYFMVVHFGVMLHLLPSTTLVPPITEVILVVLSILWTFSKAVTRVPAIRTTLQPEQEKYNSLQDELKILNNILCWSQEIVNNHCSPQEENKNNFSLDNTLQKEIKGAAFATDNPKLLLASHNLKDETQSQEISKAWNGRKLAVTAIDSYKKCQPRYNLYGLNRADELRNEIDDALVEDIRKIQKTSDGLTEETQVGVGGVLRKFSINGQTKSDLQALSVFRSMSRQSTILKNQVSQLVQPPKYGR